MADQVQGATKGTQDKIQSATTGILGSIEGWGNWITAKAKAMLDRVFPPETRAAFLAKLQAFMLANPKLSTFLGMNLAITGVPLFLFILFSLTVFIFALVVGLLVGLLGAVAFTLFAVGLALTIVLPTIFFTTMGATFLFLWGLGGYYILKWANSEGGGEATGQEGGGASIGDRLNSLTGGRLTGFMDSARNEESKKSIYGWGDANTPAKAEEKPQPAQKNNSKPQASEGQKTK
ncbi:hypothetical protein WHR41_00711 [Cladosporium halotolerans]|uniref:Uncharacterized protein n=1 Tax=Cladosporium halotolerans TaxID=1052096 RepID=A0AB34L0K9_9PEZI